MNILVSLALCILGLATYVQALTGPEIANYFRLNLSSRTGVYLPNEANYTLQTTQRWNAYRAPTYTVSVKPYLQSDVQKIIKYVQQHNVPFLATGGGHGYTDTLSALKNGVELDMGNFNDVLLDSANDRLTVGGSARFSDITQPLYTAGKEIPVGACSCIGITGATLGGGIGPYSGLHGTIADSLISIEMISGTGEYLNVSRTKEPDLFWGMKGAGFNFGVVMSLTYQVYNATNAGQAMNADMTFSASQNGSLWNLTRTFVGHQPKELSIVFSVAYSRVLQEIVIVGNFIYAGPLETGKVLIQPFLDLQHSNTNISYIAWKDLENAAIYGATVKGCRPGGEYIPYGANLYGVDVGNLIEVVNFMNKSMSQTPALQSSLLALTQYAPYGFHLFPTDSSAFSFRDTVIYAQVEGLFFNASEGPTIDAWGKQLRSRLQKGSGKRRLEVYVHFAHGDEGNRAWYTERQLPRLRELKKRFDPWSLFPFYNAISYG